MFAQIPHFPMKVMLQIDIDPAKSNYSEYLESWKRGMDNESAIALNNLTSYLLKDLKAPF